MGALTVKPTQFSQRIDITSSDFPGNVWNVAIPEAIGDVENSYWVVHKEKNIAWGTPRPGHATYHFEDPGSIKYQVDVRTGDDTVDIEIALTNNTGKTWELTHAFTCFNANGAPDFTDHELLRTYSGAKGRMVRLIEEPRQVSQRPMVELYGIEGGPAVPAMPFVDRFKATPAEPKEGFYAIEAKGGAGAMAIASRNPVYLFNNLEYSCIHSCPGYGRLEPGMSAKSMTRIYIAKGPAADCYRRFKKAFA